MKDKQWKDYWDVDLGCSYIPIDKLDPQVDMSALEEGGMFDEDTMPEWMKSMRGVAPIGPGAPGSQGPPRLGGMPVASLVGAPAVQGGQDIAAAAAAAAAFNLGMPPQLPPGAGLLPPPTNLPPQGTFNETQTGNHSATDDQFSNWYCSVQW